MMIVWIKRDIRGLWAQVLLMKSTCKRVNNSLTLEMLKTKIKSSYLLSHLLILKHGFQKEDEKERLKLW